VVNASNALSNAMSYPARQREAIGAPAQRAVTEGRQDPYRSRRRPAWRLLLGLVLVLLIGQALAGVHAVGHQFQGESDGCPTCHLAGAPALPNPPLCLAPPRATRAAESPLPVLAGPPRRARRDRHARAPPR